MGLLQTVLPFKLDVTDESLTAHGGQALHGEYIKAMNIAETIDRELPPPGRSNAYAPSVHAIPIVLMLSGGGQSLEDLRVLRRDTALRRLLQLDVMPSSDATGNWLRRMGQGEGLEGMHRVNHTVFQRLLRQDERTSFTLDIDATQIVAEKRDAKWTYKSEKGYMPMVGHIAELGLVVGHEFREGNVAPQTRNLEFMQDCDAAMPKGRKIVAVRIDSAGYQAKIFNWCEATDKVYAIGADQDAAVKAAIAVIAEADWKPFRDGWIAETVHCMNKTDKAFRLVVMRRPRDVDLFEQGSPWRYHAIASNREDEDAAATMIWYSKRGDTSENRIKELKIGFGMESMPCGQFQANAMFFAIGVLAYNLFLGFRSSALDDDWSNSQVRTVRWRLFQTPGKVVCHARQVVLKIGADMLDAFRQIRERCARIALDRVEGGAFHGAS
jgi:hypothetical protein